MKTKIKDGTLFLEIPLSMPGVCKVVERSGNHLIGTSAGVATVETPWGVAGLGLNMWIKPENVTVRTETAEVAAAKKTG